MSKKIPRTLEYISGLPKGFDGYPEQQVRGDVFASTCELVRGRVDLSQLPQGLASHISGQDSREWVPDTYGAALILLARDLLFESDDEAVDWFYQTNAELIRRPLYRVVMLALSPTLMLMGTSKRWGAFRKGSEMVADKAERRGDRMHARVHLRYPPGLYPDLCLRAFGTAMRAVLDAGRAQDIQLQHQLAEFGHCIYEASWQA